MNVATKQPALPLRDLELLAEWNDECEEEEDEFYITSDGKPMAETIQHRDLMIYYIEGLRARYAEEEYVHVSGNDFIHYLQGDRTAHVSPDCYIVFGVDKRLRTSYKVWEEGDHFPDVIIEFTSKKTRTQDFGRKKDLYEKVFQTAEYFTFDPTGVRRNPRLRGFRLRNGQYEEMRPAPDGRLHSEKLGLDLVPEGTWLRCYDPVTQEFMRTPQESEELARRAEELARRAEAAEAEVARLRAELERRQSS